MDSRSTQGVLKRISRVARFGLANSYHRVVQNTIKCADVQQQNVVRDIRHYSE
jgi:hypothetical protein